MGSSYPGQCFGEESTSVVVYDDRDNIGKHCLSQDKTGAPFCVTIDLETLEDNMVTVRDRGTATQKRVLADKLSEYIQEKIKE